MLSEFTSIILCLAHSEKLSSHMVYGTNFEWIKERSGTCLCLSKRSYLVIATAQENFLFYRHLLKRLGNVCLVEMQVINPWYYCYRIMPLMIWVEVDRRINYPIKDILAEDCAE